MPLQQSAKDFEHVLRDAARIALGPDESDTRQAFLQQIADDLWLVANAPVQAEDEPALLL